MVEQYNKNNNVVKLFHESPIRPLKVGVSVAFGCKARSGLPNLQPGTGFAALAPLQPPHFMGPPRDS